MSKYSKIVATLGVITGLGIASLPLASFAAPIPLVDGTPKSANVKVQLTVGDAVAIAVNSNDANAGNAAPNQTKNAATTVSYATNKSTGMTLTVKDADVDTNMTAGHTGTVAGTDVIAAGTQGAVAGQGQWSIKGGLLALKVAESSAPVNTDVAVTYNISTGASQLPGTYEDTIVYTAAVK